MKRDAESPKVQPERTIIHSLPATAVSRISIDEREDDELLEAVEIRAGGHPVLTIARMDPTDVRLRERFSLPPAARQKLNPIMQQVPALLVRGAEVATSYNKLRMILNPETEKLIASGVLEMVPSQGVGGAFRGTVRAVDSKKFVESANFLSSFNPAVALGAVWQITAIATSQAYLASIDARLARLEKGVASIREYIEDVLVAELNADREYIQRWASSLRSTDVPSDQRQVVLNQLESIERSAAARSLLFAKQLSRKFVEIEDDSWTRNFFQVGDVAQEVHNQIDACKRLVVQAEIAAEVRIAAVALREVIRPQREHSLQILESVRDSLTEANEEWKRIRALVRKKVPGLRPKLALPFIDRSEHYQRELPKTLMFRRSKDGPVAAIESLRLHVAQDLRGPNAVIDVEFEVDPDGTIVNAYRLVSPSPASEALPSARKKGKSRKDPRVPRQRTKRNLD